MKKLLYSAAAMVLAFFAASCQQENLEPVVGGNTVTYTVQVPESIQTKALGDEVATVNKVYYQVYRAAEVADLAKTYVYDGYADVNAGQASFELEFVKNQEFVVLFWAQNSALQMFNIADLRSVELTTPGKANNANAQVFAGMDTVADCVSTQGGDVTLVRPISQLNIATNAESLQFGTTDIDLLSSTVTVTGLYPVYNVATGEVGGTESTFTYTDAQIFDETLTVNGQLYTYAAMNYVGFAPETGVTVDVDFTITTSEGDVPHSVANVPVKPNYRTNIVGNLLTEAADYNVTLDAAWAGEYILASNAEQFTQALSNAKSGDIINLAAGEYVLPTSLFSQATSGTFTIEGNGVDTEVKGAINSNANSPGVYANGKHLVFKDLTYVTPNNGYNGGFGHAASVTFINCTIVGQFYAHSSAPHYFYDCTIDPLTGYLYTYGSDCVFEGCTFAASEGKALQIYQDAGTGETTVTIKDCDFVAAKQAATWDGKPVTGIDVNSNGALFNVYVENCTTTGFPTGLNSGSDLYNIKNGGLGKVNLWIDGEQVAIVGLTPVADGVGKDSEGAYVIFNANGLFWFAEQINSIAPYEASEYDNATFKLYKDIDLNNREWSPIGDWASQRTEFHGTFDGQGHTISNFVITKPKEGEKASDSAYGLFGNVKGGTVKNVTVSNVSISGVAKFAAALVGRLDGNVENCHVNYASVLCSSWQVGGLVAQYNGGTISGCSVNNTTVSSGIGAVGAIAGYALTNVERTIENCSVNGCTLVQTEPYGAGYDDMYAAILGGVHISGTVINVNGCVAENNTIKGKASNQLVGYIEPGAKAYVDGDLYACAETTEQLEAALKAGGHVALVNNVTMTKSIALSSADFTLEGNGYTVTMPDDATNTYALFDITGGKAAFKNVTFNGVKSGAVVRTVGVEFNAENVTAQNGQHTQQQGLFRLMGKSTIKNCTFKNNTCSMVITLNYDGANNDPQVVENCVFEGNTCNGTAALYYVKGASATINANRFVGNTVNCNSNGATIYMGFTENNVVTNNLFQNNTVNEASTSSRVAGGVFFGYETEFTGNAFVGNKVTGTNAKGNDVCVSTYYTSIDLSGNYWDGNAPVEDTNYFVQHKSDERVVVINDYLTANPFN